MRSKTSGSDDAIIEWAPFRLAPGVDERTLLDASASLQEEFLSRQPGFVRRELLRGEDGEWVDLVVWTDPDSAKGAIEAANASPACHAYFHLMKGGEAMDAGEAVLHYRRIGSY